MPRARGGFTLVEVFVVLIILGAMAAVAAPAFRSPPEEDNLTVATNLVKSLLDIARDSAVSSASNVTVVIDSGTTRAWIVGAARDTSAETRMDVHAADVLAGLELGQVLDLPQGISMQLSKTRARFAFRPDGSAFPDSLVLHSSLGDRLITIDPWTGRVLY